MTSYIALSLLAYAIFAATNVLDKVVLGPRRVDPLGYLLYSAACSPLVLMTVPFARLQAPGTARQKRTSGGIASPAWSLFPCRAGFASAVGVLRVQRVLFF